jgi:hypothetical protein
MVPRVRSRDPSAAAGNVCRVVVIPRRYGPGMGLVHRTARVRLRVTRGQARRCYGLLRAGGDVWAALIDVNRERFRGGARREMTGAPLGELARVCAEGIAKRYCDAFIETARRRRRGERARYPRRKRALFPMRFRTGAFALDGRRVRLAVARAHHRCGCAWPETSLIRASRCGL